MKQVSALNWAFALLFFPVLISNNSPVESFTPVHRGQQTNFITGRELSVIKSSSLASSRGSDNENGDIVENLSISTVALLGISSAAIMLWSESSIALSRCGPVLLPDWLEGSAYISTFIIAAASNLARIIFGTTLTEFIIDDSTVQEDEMFTPTLLFEVAETLSFAAMLGAFTVLGMQLVNGDAFADGAGLSGIDVRWCRLMYEG